MDELTCKSARASLWDYSAGILEERKRRAVASHLGDCRECGRLGGEVASLRTGLRHLPVIRPPALVRTRLQILASRERSRALARQDPAAWLKERASRARLFFDNLLRPFAVPAAGGLLASFLCFGILVNNLHVQADWDNDMPLGLYTEVAITEMSPFCTHRDVMVQLTVDASGNVTDYFVPQGTTTPEELREIGNLILYSTFTPATRFGQRLSSKRMVLIAHMDVKG